MDSKIKEWIDLYAKIAESIGELVVILDSSFEILHANQKAASEFYVDDFTLTLEQIFTDDTVRNLTDEIGPALFSNQKKSIKNFLININTGNSSEYDLIINPVEVNGDKIVLLVFSKKNFDTSEFIVDKIQLRLDKYQLQEKNDFILSLIKEIEQLVPFTIIGLKKLQFIIDQYIFPIWLKDTQSRFIVINKSYSEILGIDMSLAPGKKQEAFLPVHLVSIFKSLDDYIFNTSNPVFLEGFGKKVNSLLTNRNVIQLPLLDKRNKVYGLLGLINEENSVIKKEFVPPDLVTEFIERLPKAAALINSEGKFEQANKEFCKFLGKDRGNVISKNFVDLFSYLFSENIKLFIDSDLNSDELFIGSDLNPVDYSSSLATVNLLKISSGSEFKKHIIIIIDDSKKNKQDDNELQTFIKNRGKMFDILIQNNPEPIFVYDKENLKFLEVNEAAIKFYGFSRDEFLEMDLTDLYAPEDIQTLLNSFGDESSEGKFSEPFRHRKKDGSTVVVEISKTSFRFNDREAHFNIVKDITSSVEKDKQNQMLKAIFNSTDSLVFNTDASGFITFINSPVIEKLAFTSEELIKSSFATLVPDEDRAIINTSIFQSQIRDEVTLETKIKNNDGEFIEAEITASPILDFNNEVESFTIIVKPLKISATTETPKEIVREVIKEVIVEKVPAINLKSKPPDPDFISGVFHEILTPMNVIIGFAQELVNGIENPTEEQQESAEIIKQNRVKMMDTMNALVEYSDILQNKSVIKIEDITVTDIVDVLDKNIKDITGLNDIQFSYGKISSSLTFKSDRQKFERFIFSLIKIISRISKDKKVYFSAYPIDSDTFFIGLSDQYGNTSEYVANTFDMVFNEEKDPKDYGLPKLTTYLAKIILSLLDGKFHRSVFGAARQEAGFLFPMVLVTKEENLFAEPKVVATLSVSEEETVKLNSDQPEREITDSNDEPEVFEQATELDDSSKIASEVIDEKSSSADQEEEDIFKPVTSITEELFSKVEEDTVQSETKMEADEPEAPETPVEKITSHAEETSEVPIPEVKEEPEAPFVPPLPQLNLADLNCLYIEDQVDSQILFKVQMKGLKDVKFAVSFEESQPMLLNNQFDFIVMDINLQGEYNGLDALKIIRTMPALTNTPIIAVTAYVLPGDKEKFIAAGFDDFISKPIFREKMMESLEKIFLHKY